MRFVLFSWNINKLWRVFRLSWNLGIFLYCPKLVVTPGKNKHCILTEKFAFRISLRCPWNSRQNTAAISKQTLRFDGKIHHSGFREIAFEIIVKIPRLRTNIKIQIAFWREKYHYRYIEFDFEIFVKIPCYVLKSKYTLHFDGKIHHYGFH